MKYIKISLLIVGVLAIGSIILSFMSSDGNIEMYPYEVIKAYEQFEVRKYESANFAYVKMPENTYEQASSKGFRTLAGYIFGANEKEQKIAMTSPVAMNMEDSITMMFMVPSQYELGELPKPTNSSIQFKKEPGRVMAAIEFGGWANDKRIGKYTNQLKSALEKQNIAYTGSFSFLGYNPPYRIFNRRNEIVVEVMDGQF